jgi:hypothetical protein
MSPLSLAQAYLDAVFGPATLDDLSSLLHPTLEFTGPLSAYDSAAAYIEAMKADPPEGFGYQLLHRYEDEASACIVYEFSRDEMTLLMAQTFEVEGGKIKRIRLIFDSDPFS